MSSAAEERKRIRARGDDNGGAYRQGVLQRASVVARQPTDEKHRCCEPDRDQSTTEKQQRPMRSAEVEVEDRPGDQRRKRECPKQHQAKEDSNRPLDDLCPKVLGRGSFVRVADAGL